MGRHADNAHKHGTGPTRLHLILGGALVVALVSGLLVWSLGNGEDAPGLPCASPGVVRITVVPELGGLVSDLLAEPIDLGDDACAVAEVVTKEPLQTMANLGALEASSLPHVWVPDSSLWQARISGAELEPAGSLASSPVVLASNQEAVDALGWVSDPPSWAEVLAAGRPLAVPDLGANVEALSAMAAVRESLGGGEAADTAVVQVALTASRGIVPAPAEAIAAAIDGGTDAPLGALSEQEIFTTNVGAGRTALVAVYPRDGSPMLTYPILRVGQAAQAERPAVDAVIDVLTSERAEERAIQAGFRGADGSAAFGDTGGLQAAAPVELPLDGTTVQTLLARLSALAVPARLLTLIDISTSMAAPVGSGTRATLARDAAKSALTLLADSASVGLWVFASELDTGNDWAELVPIRTLAADAGGVPQRQELAAQLDTVPQRLVRGGTSLYDSTLAAVQAARDQYDPDSVSSVIVITDGKNEDDTGIQLPALVDTLRDEADPKRPVRVIGIALGADADLGALQQIADATDGAAYSAAEPGDLQSVLFQAIGRRG